MWIRQSVVPSVTKSARSRTAYLSSVVPQVQSAIQAYLRNNPSGGEVTLAVMEAVGLASLNVVRGTRSLNTTKQDLGLLVVMTLVDLYGESAVETDRRPNSRSAATQRNTWASLPWVSSYTPHQVNRQTHAETSGDH